MAIDSFPQYADPILRFTKLHFNVTPKDINLSTVDDIILSISKDKIEATPLLVLTNLLNASRFSIDNTVGVKQVDVKVLSSEVGDEVGIFYANLWIVETSRYMTHLTKKFEVTKAVNFTT